MKKIASRFLQPLSFVIMFLGLMSAPDAFSMEHVDQRERSLQLFQKKAAQIAEQTKQNNEFALRWNVQIQGVVGDLHRATEALTKLAAEKKKPKLHPPVSPRSWSKKKKKLKQQRKLEKVPKRAQISFFL